jgi:hypothetical protein
MAYRYTNTDKWNDAWFSSLKPSEKLLFIYLCDNCDIAGFIEFVPKIWALRIGCPEKEVLNTLKGLSRGLYYSESKDCVYIINFLRHQKNFPLNESNQCHKGIFKRFEQYKLKFKITTISEFLERVKNQNIEPLLSPYGNGNGIGKDNSLIEEDIKLSTITWKTSFELYLENLEEGKKLITPEYILEREGYHKGLDIKLTLEKSIKDYWGKEEGWKNKKSSKSEKIDWLKTFNNALTNNLNKVWKPRQFSEPVKAISQAQGKILN